MKKLPIAALGLAAAMFLPMMPAAEAGGPRIQVTLAPLVKSHHPPALGRRQGWLSISNRYWSGYTLATAPGGKLFLYREGQGQGQIFIPSGTTVTVALEKDTYDLYGNNPERLKVQVREGRTTTLSLEPFGYAGANGLTGVVNDGSRVRNGTLFDSYATPVVIRQPPPPPPVIVMPPAHRPPPPPVIIRPPAHRPPPPPPPPPPPRHNSRDRHNDGLNLIFNFGKK